VSTTWGGSGDIALYYRENSAPAPSGLRVTWSATSGGLANMQGAVADYRRVATLGALDQAMVSDGHGTSASAGPTAPVAAGELVVAAVLTSGQPVFATAGSSQMVPYVLAVRTGRTTVRVLSPVPPGGTPSFLGSPWRFRRPLPVHLVVCPRSSPPVRSLTPRHAHVFHRRCREGISHAEAQAKLHEDRAAGWVKGRVKGMRTTEMAYGTGRLRCGFGRRATGRVPMLALLGVVAGGLLGARPVR